MASLPDDDQAIIIVPTKILLDLQPAGCQHQPLNIQLHDIYMCVCMCGARTHACIPYVYVLCVYVKHIHMYVAICIGDAVKRSLLKSQQASI